MDQAQDFKSLQDQIQKALISTTKVSGQIATEDLSFQRSLNPAVGEALDEQSERLLALASALIKSAVSISELKAPTLQDADDVENNWRNVVDVVDSLLEKSDTCLDEYTGRIKRKESPTSEQSPVYYDPVYFRMIFSMLKLSRARRRNLDLEMHSARRIL